MVSDLNLDKQIEELQVLEKNLQNFLMQKQSLQIELNEITNALDEIKKSKDEVYRVIGGIMIRSDPETLKRELEEKNKVSSLRIESIEKQEKLLETKADKLRNEINEIITKENATKK